MSLSITQRPTVTIIDETSRWNAVGNPIVYKFQRTDFIWNTLNNNSGTARLFFSSQWLGPFISVGDPISLVSNDGVYNDVGTVTVITEFVPGQTRIETDIPFISSTITGGHINIVGSKPGYRIEVNLYDLNDELINEEPFIYSPDSAGYLLLNVSGIIKNQLSPDIDLNLASGSVQDDATVYKGFYIGYKEIWSGSSESEVLDNGQNIYAVFSAMQIPSLYGGNMAEFVTFDGGILFPTILSKFKNTYPAPGKIWRGYPNLISVISGDDLVSDDTVFEVFYYDENNGLISSGETSPADDSGKVLALNIGQTLSIPSNAKYTDIQFRIDDPVQPVMTSPHFEIVDPCNNPIMLMARNSLGGVLSWVFDQSQEYSYDYGNGRKAKRLVLVAENLSINEWEALQDFITLGDIYKNNILELTASTIKTSTRIGQQVYVVGQDGSKIGVIAIPTRNKTLTKNVKHYFELEIEYPEVFEA